MSDNKFDIGADDIDVTKIVDEIRTAVEKKTRDGLYADSRITRAEKLNLPNLKNDDGFVTFYLECLKDAIYVDISDFEITERRSGIGFILVPVKRLIWKFLKFYTYRLWSQQNQSNGLLLSAIESMDNLYRKKMSHLEERIAKLEKQNK